MRMLDLAIIFDFNSSFDVKDRGYCHISESNAYRRDVKEVKPSITAASQALIA